MKLTLIFISLIMCTGLFAQNHSNPTIENTPPVVVKTIPEAGSRNVSRSLKEIEITFSKEMMTVESWSVVIVSQNSFPKINGQVKFEKDKRTFVMPVKLEPNKTYAMWLNQGNNMGFRDKRKVSAIPYLLVFKTGP